MKKQYFEIGVLENINLEESYVNAVYELEGNLIFEIDAVLTQNHSLYKTPSSSEAHFVKKAKLFFKNVSNIRWKNMRLVANLDADNKIDFGNIDQFSFSHKDYHLTGVWGEVEFSSEAFELIFE